MEQKLEFAQWLVLGVLLGALALIDLSYFSELERDVASVVLLRSLDIYRSIYFSEYFCNVGVETLNHVK